MGVFPCIFFTKDCKRILCFLFNGLPQLDLVLPQLIHRKT